MGKAPPPCPPAPVPVPGVSAASQPSVHDNSQLSVHANIVPAHGVAQVPPNLSITSQVEVVADAMDDMEDEQAMEERHAAEREQAKRLRRR